MYSKNKIKRKAIVLTTCSILGVNLMVNKDSAQAMKKLKAIGNSIKKAVTQEDKKRMRQQQQLEEEIATLMCNKLCGLGLTKEQEDKLVSNIEIVKISNGNVNAKYEKIKIVNPVSSLIIHYDKEDKFVSLLEWINLHIPEAFNVDNITTALFRAIEEGDTSYTKDAKWGNKKKQKATAMCKHLLVYNPDLSKKCECKIKRKPYTFTALEYAQKVGLPEVVEMILNKSGDKQYLLYNAICSGNQEEVKKAISEGANINELVHGADFENYNPVTLALMKKNIAMADFLIQNGAKPESILDIALVIRDAEVFDYLIQKGAKLSENASPIELIFKDFGNQKWSFWKDQNNIKFIEKMIQDERIDITWKEDYNKFFDDNQVYTNKIIRDFYLAHFEEISSTTLRAICSDTKISEPQKIELAKIFFDKYCDVSGDSEPLVLACFSRNYNLAKFLIEHGSPVRITKTYQTYSPLAAVIHNFFDIPNVGEIDVNFVKYLVNDCNASLDGAQFNGKDLCFVFQNYFFENANPNLANAVQDIATFLIKNGLNVNSIDRGGNTFLESCIEERRERRQEFTTLGNTLFNLFTKAGAKRYLD